MLLRSLDTLRSRQKKETPRPPSCAPEPHGGLLTLPNELIKEISTLLRPVDLRFFSLTCKRLYSLLCRRARSSLVFEDQKRQLLLLLEDQLPHWLLCHRCIKLFKWKPSKRNYKTPFCFQPMHHLVLIAARPNTTQAFIVRRSWTSILPPRDA